MEGSVHCFVFAPAPLLCLCSSTSFSLWLPPLAPFALASCCPPLAVLPRRESSSDITASFLRFVLQDTRHVERYLSIQQHQSLCFKSAARHCAYIRKYGCNCSVILGGKIMRKMLFGCKHCSGEPWGTHASEAILDAALNFPLHIPNCLASAAV